MSWNVFMWNMLWTNEEYKYVLMMYIWLHAPSSAWWGLIVDSFGFCEGPWLEMWTFVKEYELVGTTNTSWWSIFYYRCTFVCIIKTSSGLCWHLWRSMTWMWTFMKHHGNSSVDYNMFWWSIFNCTCIFVCTMTTYNGLFWHLWRLMTWMWTFLKHHGNFSEDYNMFWWSTFDYTCTFVCTMKTYSGLYWHLYVKVSYLACQHLWNIVN
jgi:hypothetical protein